MSKSSCRLKFRVSELWEFRSGHFHFQGPLPDLRGLRCGTTYSNMDKGITITVLENKEGKRSCLVRFSVHEEKVMGLGLGTMPCALLVKPKKGTMSTEGKKGAAMILTTFLERMLEEATTKDSRSIENANDTRKMENDLKTLMNKDLHCLQSENLITEQKLREDNQRKEQSLKREHQRKEQRLKEGNERKEQNLKREHQRKEEKLKEDYQKKLKEVKESKLKEVKRKHDEEEEATRKKKNEEKEEKARKRKREEEEEAARKRKRAGPECPVCLEGLGTGRIFQCSSGHLLCSSCYSRVKECPSRCGGKMMGRAIGMEQYLRESTQATQAT